MDSTVDSMDSDSITMDGIGLFGAGIITDTFLLRYEDELFAYPDFESIVVEHGTESGEFGILLTEDLDRIVSERAEVISNNLVLDGTEDGHLQQSQADAGSDILTEDGESLGIEDDLRDGISFILGEDKSVSDNLLDETDADVFVYDGKADLNVDVFLRQNITTKVTASVNVATPNGLEFLATKTIEGITGDGIELEVGSSQKGSRLLLTQTDGSASDLGDHILLEAASDFNINQSVTSTTYTALGYSSNNFSRDSLVFFPNENDGLIDDTIILEGQEIGTFKLEDETTVATTFGDDLLLEDSTGFGVGQKIQLERTFISLEDSLNTGMTPFGISGNTILDPFNTPADIFVNTIGKLTAEEDYDFIVFNTEADENDQIILEDGTETDLYIQAIDGS